MRNINKILNAFVFAFISIFLCCNSNVYAKNNVSNIYEEVVLHQDGTAEIFAKWMGTFNEGTEVYIPINTKDIIVKDLSVFKIKDNTRQFYTNVLEWNVGSSFEEKKYKSSIRKIDSENIEICFGISEYGYNEYYISYSIENFVKKYQDEAGFNFMLINKGMSTFPTNVRIEITYPDGSINLSEENSKIYAFGFYGECEFKNGKGVVTSSKALENDESVIVAMSFDKKLFVNADSVSVNFKDILDKAKENSNYNNDENNFDIFKLLFFIVLFSIIVVIVYKLNRYIKLKNFYKNCRYYRDIPNNNDLYLSYILLLDFYYKKIDKTNIIPAIIMKLEKNKNIETVINKRIGFFGIEKRNIEIKLLKEPNNNIEKSFYEILKYASGEDNILQEKELKEYVENNIDEYKNLIDETINIGRNSLKEKNGYKNVCGNNLSDLTDIGKNELEQCFGLKKYLNDYSLIEEREIQEISIWQNYLIFALLSGDAKKVLKDIKKIYPAYEEMIEKYEIQLDTTMIIAQSIQNTLIYSNVGTFRNQGFGGASSYFGGAGYSGGGYGGGTR